ncbi:hypothetical protein ON010_g6657 [Phytophthora cinnamomi]|nr:hypothetical protein ON010_g6657 [Phytophthora cinnamomi]
MYFSLARFLHLTLARRLHTAVAAEAVLDLGDGHVRRLWHHEVDKDDGQDGRAQERREAVVRDGVFDVREADADDERADPLHGDADADRGSTGRVGEQLGDDGPEQRADTQVVAHHEEAEEDDR